MSRSLVSVNVGGAVPIGCIEPWIKAVGPFYYKTRSRENKKTPLFSLLCVSAFLNTSRMNYKNVCFSKKIRPDDVGSHVQAVLR